MHQQAQSRPQRFTSSKPHGLLLYGVSEPPEINFYTGAALAATQGHRHRCRHTHHTALLLPNALATVARYDKTRLTDNDDDNNISDARVRKNF
jgi:hypothetical protein